MMNKSLMRKRGIALELGITTMLLIFALCSLLVTVAQLESMSNKKIVRDLDFRIELERIGEDFANNCISGNVGGFHPSDYPSYTIYVDSISGGNRLRVLSVSTGDILLLIDVNRINGITKWEINLNIASPLQEE